MDEKILLEVFKNDIDSLMEDQAEPLKTFILEKYHHSSGKPDECGNSFKITFSIHVARVGDDIQFFTTLEY